MTSPGLNDVFPFIAWRRAWSRAFLALCAVAGGGASAVLSGATLRSPWACAGASVEGEEHGTQAMAVGVEGDQAVAEVLGVGWLGDGHAQGFPLLIQGVDRFAAV